MSKVDDLDPSIREFQKRVAADYERHSATGIDGIVERRRVAELVRAPWTEGGPQMVETLERMVGERRVPIRIHRPSSDPTFRSLSTSTAAAGCSSASTRTTG